MRSRIFPTLAAFCWLLLIAAAAHAAPTLQYQVTPWRSVMLRWSLPGATLYVSRQPIKSVRGLQPYQPRPTNLALLWDTHYRYDAETDPAVLKTDDTSGWNPFPDLSDGTYGDGAVSCNMTWGGGEKRFAPVFTFDRAYRIREVKLIAQATDGNPQGASSLAVYAGPTADALRLVKEESVVLPRGKYEAVSISLPATEARCVKLRLVTRDQGVNLGEVEILGINRFAAERSVELNDLEIGQRYYATVVSGKQQATTRFVVPKLLAAPDLSEHFGVNVHMEGFYSHPEQIEQAAKLMAAARIKYVRWYAYGGYQRVLNCLKKYGIGAYLLSYAPGTVLTGCGNEPELAKQKPAAVAANIRAAREKAKQDNPHYLVGGPTCMGVSLDYAGEVLDGLKPGELDFLDFHPYIGPTNAVLPGLRRSQPENVALLYDQWRALLKKHGFAGIPLVPSEFGYTTYDGSAWATAVTPTEQAAYLARAYLAHIAQGAPLCFWYDFRNDGNDGSNMEHNFGIVTNDLKPKPAYIAYQTLTRLLADKVFTGRIAALRVPNFGYAFSNRESGRRVYAFVNATGRTRLRVDLPAQELRLYDLYGKPLPLRNGAQGGAEFLFAGAPVYLVAPRAARVTDAKALPLPVKQEITVKPLQRLVTAFAPNPAELSAQVSNTYKRPMTVTLTATCPGFTGKAVTRITLPAGATQRVTLKATLKGDATAVYPVQLRADAGTASEVYLYVVRPATREAEAYQTDINGDGKAEVVLQNRGLHLIVAPAAGSRLFRVIDRRTGADQIYVPSAIRGGLADIAASAVAGEYLSTSTVGGFILSTPFNARTFEAESGVGVEMEGNTQGLAMTHRIELPSARPDAVVQRYVFTNRSEQPKQLDLNSHPQFTPGGAIAFGKVDIAVPSGGQVKESSFLAFRGDMGALTPDQGWWRTVNTLNGYSLSCEFDPAQVGSVRQWHDGEFFNMELHYKRITLQPGETASLTYTYLFKPRDQ